MYANKSLYNHHLWVAGIVFGAGHLHILKAGGLILVDVRQIGFYLASFAIFGLLYLYKINAINRKEKLYEVSRSLPHMFSDYLCAIGSVSVLTLLSYIIVVDEEPLITNFRVSQSVAILIVNVIIFCLGFVGLRNQAKKERGVPNTTSRKKVAE